MHPICTPGKNIIIPLQTRETKVNKIDTKVTDNPKLKEKTLSDGQISLYLEYYLGYSKQYDEEKDKEVVKIIRKKEFLNLYIWQAPRTPLERQQNRETLELAKKIRFEREQELKAGKLARQER